MRSAVNVLAVCCAGCALAAAAPAPAAADLGGWVPSLAVTGGVTMQEEAASVESFCAFGGPEDPTNLFSPDCIGHVSQGPAPLRRANKGTDWSVVPIVGFDLQLLTPTIPRIPGRPRVFVRGGLQLMFGSTHNTANEGNPGTITTPGNRPNRNAATAALLGVGSRTVSETQTLGWGAGGGLAFPFRFRGRQLWLKPGFAWTRYTVDVEGILAAGLKNDPPNPQNPADFGSELREIVFSEKFSNTMDGIGPSLEIEMDVGQFGPIGASLFVGGEAYRILGEREVRLSASVSYPLGSFGISPVPPNQYRLPADTYTANWSHEVDPWLYRASVGLRFGWLGD